MKNAFLRFSITCVLLVAGSVEAQIASITSAVSTGAVQFTDTHSLNPSLNPGSTYFSASAPWTGAPVTLSQTDPTTFDAASGILDASGYSGNNYPITLNNISLSQAVGNTGHADLIVFFVITYQIGAGGLPGGLAQYPNLLVSGTVQPAAGSYASVVGNIGYSGVNAAGVQVTSGSINYNFLDNTPGSTFNNFPVSVTPAPTLATLPAFSTLQVDGSFTFEVDPASLNVETVPEPGTQALAVAALGGLLAFCRRRKKT